MKKKYIWIGICAFLFSILAYLPLYNGEFWEIDDHELIEFYSIYINNGCDFWKSFVECINLTEIVRFPEASRFRILYYPVRIIKSFIFGNNPQYYFIFNIIILFISLSVFGIAVARFLPLLISLLSMGVLASFPFNMDLWCRLGPGEIGGILFSMIFIFSLSNIREKYGWELACVSACFAMGYKENFILLYIPLVVSMFYIYQNFENKEKLLWIVFPSITAALLGVVYYNIFIGSVKHVYSADVSSAGIFNVIIQYLLSIHFWYFVALLLLHIILYKIYQIDKKLFIAHITILVCVIIMSVGNFIFYRGDIGLGSRYGFPFYFLHLVALLESISIISCIKYNKVVMYLISSGMVLLIVVILCMQYKIYLHSVAHIDKTKEFKKILDLGKEYQVVALINTGDDINMYERFYSFKKFSLAGLTAPKVVYFPLFYGETTDNLGKKLRERLQSEVNTQGDFILNSQEVLLVNYNHGWRTVDFLKKKKKIDLFLHEVSGKYVTIFMPSDTKTVRKIVFYNKNDYFPHEVIINDVLAPVSREDNCVYSVAISNEMKLKQYIFNINVNIEFYSDIEYIEIEG